MILYVLIAALVVYFVIWIATVKRTEKVLVAFAGSYDGTDVVKSFPKERNKTIYTEGENVVDLAEYDKFIISGHSLERVGVPEGAFVYAKSLDVEKEGVYSLCNRIVVFRYDNKRLAVEHPEITNRVDGYKVRKVKSILENHLAEADFKERMGRILSLDKEIMSVEGCLPRLWSKYSFASDFYKEDKELVVSVTYKNGEYKDYSFHSLGFLHGVVKYKSV